MKRVEEILQSRAENVLQSQTYEDYYGSLLSDHCNYEMIYKLRSS